MSTRRGKAPATILWIAAALAGVLAVAGCGDRQSADHPPVAGDVAVARVDGRAVWASDVKREAIAQGLIGQGEPLDQGSDMFRQVLEQVIDQKLLATEAVRKKLDRDPIAQRRLAAARERILGDMLVEGIVSQGVTENAIRSLHAEQLRLAKQSEEFRARQIIVGSEAEAEAVMKALATGAAFEALAMERSTDVASRFNGGELGYFTIDVMPEVYSAALQAAKPGDVIGPFQTEEGWTVMKIEDRRPEPPLTLEQARPQIVRFLTYDQVRDLLERLRGHAKVEHLLAATGPTREPANAPAKPAGQEPASAADAPAPVPASATPGAQPPAAQAPVPAVTAAHKAPPAPAPVRRAAAPRAVAPAPVVERAPAPVETKPAPAGNSATQP